MHVSGFVERSCSALVQRDHSAPSVYLCLGTLASKRGKTSVMCYVMFGHWVL
jgi:hypothetical protein